MVAATDTLRYPLQRATYRTLICLLAVTGLRVGEAIGLDDDDLDGEHGVLAVTGKFDKPRQVPLHPSSVAALDAYQRRRRAEHPRPGTTALFVSTPGTRLSYVNCSRPTSGTSNRPTPTGTCTPHLNYSPKPRSASRI